MLRIREILAETAHDLGKQLGVGVVVEEADLPDRADEQVTLRGALERGNEVFRPGELDVEFQTLFDALYVLEHGFIGREQVGVDRRGSPAGVDRGSAADDVDPGGTLAA